MSNTRHAETSAQFRQERFASSAAFDRGLMGNLVAKRCKVLDDEQDRALVWFLQLVSHSPGGLAKLAADLVEKFPARIATKSMLKFGCKPGQSYDAGKVRIVRAEIDGQAPRAGVHPFFPLKGETNPESVEVWDRGEDWYESASKEKKAAEKFPTEYPAAAFAEKCAALAAQHLPGLLAEICLNPDLPPSGCSPAWFPSLYESLCEFQAAWIADHRAAFVVTDLGREVFETLDYALESGCMVLIDGLARTGKTFSVKAWCNQHPGQARYIQVPSSTDDIGFFRAIASALGVSINQNSKAHQLRDRVEEVLQRGNLMPVFDEAHYLWPQSKYRDALPCRVNWIMTALVNHGVPVALVTTPQFMRAQKTIERKTAWTGEQLTGRIGHYQKLPDTLSLADLSAVAKSLFPEGSADSIEYLAAQSLLSAKQLAAIQSAVARARFLARKGNRPYATFNDVKTAVRGSVIPSDTGLASALSETKPPARSRAVASRPRNIGAASASPAPAPRRSIAPALETGEETNAERLNSGQILKIA